MKLESLQRHIRTLAMLPETAAPVVSCYLELSKGRVKDRNTLEERFRWVERGLSGARRREVADARRQIDRYLATELLPDAKGLAAFARAGDQPFFLALQFQVALPNWIASDTTPNIYHLVELKDTYRRYVVMICCETSMRILDVNLGSVTAQLWHQRPELRRRVGREWTKEHYQNHRRDRAQKFIREKIEVLENLMSAGGHTHLILAGHPTITSRVRSALPKHLAAMLVDVVPASGTTPVDDVVESTIAAFVAAEENESRAAADELTRQLQTGGLAVAGTEATYRALCRGQADVVVLGKQYEPGLGWMCDECEHFDLEHPKPVACPVCHADALHAFDVKQAIARMAEQQGCVVEVVEESSSLRQVGGVGCLLRYRLPEDYISRETNRLCRVS